MKHHGEGVWHWPGWGRLGYALLLAGTVSLWFAVVFVGADQVTARRSFRVRVHLDAELRTPFAPAAVLGYLSLYGLFAAPPFILRTRGELRALAAALAAVIAVAGICFLLVPVQVAFPAAGDTGAWTGLVRFAKYVALRNNLLPSLHVALGVVCVAVLAGRVGWRGRVVLWLWAVAIGVSALLLHQHYLLDVLAGFGLGWLGFRWVYCRRTRGRA